MALGNQNWRGMDRSKILRGQRGAQAESPGHGRLPSPSVLTGPLPGPHYHMSLTA